MIELKCEFSFSKLGPLLEDGTHEKCLAISDLDQAEIGAFEKVGLKAAECSFHLVKATSGKFASSHVFYDDAPLNYNN